MAVQDLLSQDEIDALLHGVDDGLVQTDTAAEPGSVKSYDLTSQDRIVRGRMPTLEMINESYCSCFMKRPPASCNNAHR
jgi:flagellar motor switch protein FliM